MAVLKKEIFLSSRFEEFEKLRIALVELLRNTSDMEPIYLDNNKASNKSALEESLSKVKKSDTMILIIGDTYGTIPKDENKSYIHLEYDVAHKGNANILIYEIVDTYEQNTNNPKIDLRLIEWKNELMDKHRIATYSRDEDIYKIACQIMQSLNENKEEDNKNNNSVKQIPCRDTRYIDNIIDMAKQHYKAMGYDISETLPKYNNMKLSTDNAFSVTMESKHKNYIDRFTIIPILRDKLELNQFRFLEAKLFWEYRNIIWSDKFFNKIKKDLDITNDDLLNESIGDKLKLAIFNTFNDITGKDLYTNNKRVIFYLYIVNPPKYEKTDNKIVLIEKGDCVENKELPHVFLNLTTYPRWYPINNLNTKKLSETYPNCLSIYQKLLSKLSSGLLSKAERGIREKYNINIAESLCITFLQQCGFVVNTNDSKSSLLEVNTRDTNGQKKQLLISVKYKSYRTDELFCDSLNSGELKDEAKKYEEYRQNIYLFMFIYFEDKNKVKVYRQLVLNKNYIKPKQLREVTENCSIDKVLYLEKLAQSIFGR